MKQEVARLYFDSTNPLSLEEYNQMMDQMTSFEWEEFQINRKRAQNFATAVCQLFLAKMATLIMPDTEESPPA